jgi:iron complex transport system substrate-binding protein
MAIPTGVHPWGNRTVEQPLTVLWAASVIHHEIFKDWDVGKEITSFYARFFRTHLTKPQVAEILGGRR